MSSVGAAATARGRGHAWVRVQHRPVGCELTLWKPGPAVSLPDSFHLKGGGGAVPTCGGRRYLDTSTRRGATR